MRGAFLWVSSIAQGILSLTLLACSTDGPLVVRNHSGSVDAAVSAPDASARVTPPAVDVTWQVQLSGSFDSSVDVMLYYVDLDSVTSTQRAAILAVGRHLACYLSAGTYEPFRADAQEFPAAALGNALMDYPDERWLDIRNAKVTSLMSARLDQYRALGCSSVAVANVTTTENTGFDITAANQSEYLDWLSAAIHDREMLAGLATGDDRVALMEPRFDWAYAQGCWATNHCTDYSPFVTAKKAVLGVEFGDASTAPTLCSGVPGSGVNLLIKPRDLSAKRTACLP